MSQEEAAVRRMSVRGKSRELKSDSCSVTGPVNGELSSQPGGDVVCGSQVGKSSIKGSQTQVSQGARAI
jgi:hypothetical protein